VTKLEDQRPVVCETGAMVKCRLLFVEFSALTLRIRLKGARWTESIFLLGAMKAANPQCEERAAQKRSRRSQ
jgi:hypothetical protein